jgi:hypothetical protein
MDGKTLNAIWNVSTPALNINNAAGVESIRVISCHKNLQAAVERVAAGYMAYPQVIPVPSVENFQYYPFSGFCSGGVDDCTYSTGDSAVFTYHFSNVLSDDLQFKDCGFFALDLVDPTSSGWSTSDLTMYSTSSCIHQRLLTIGMGEITSRSSIFARFRLFSAAGG